MQRLFNRTIPFCFFFFFLYNTTVRGQERVAIDGSTQEHVFTFNEIQWLEDPQSTFTINQVKSAAFEKRFRQNTDLYPKNVNSSSVYWCKIKVRLDSLPADKESLIEFFDQTTDDISAYIPGRDGYYKESNAGAAHSFDKRLFKHKNFEFKLLNKQKGEYTYYFRLRSRERVNVIIVYRTVARFIHYALTEYLCYGIFYGMILIFCLHNLLMFMAVKKLQHLFYVLYILSVGFYELSVDGIAFQYIWPDSPNWNQYAYGTFLFLISVFALEFTKALLRVKEKALPLYKLINIVIALRTVYYLYCFFFDKNLFIYKFIDFVPLTIAFGTGIWIWVNGFKPARFFVVGYTFLFLSFLLKSATALGVNYLVGRIIGHYSLSIGFVFEMVFLSFSIGDQVRLLRKEKDKAQEEIINQMAINVALKDSINRDLEEQVRIRTAEVVRQSNEIIEQSTLIESQNEELMAQNHQLEMQAEEISRMNVLLEKDNIKLKTKIEKVTDDRAMSTELSFEEFSAKYPDQETCYKFLSELKWSEDYKCLRCENTNYCAGRMPYSRRCTKCSYEESVLQRTIFHNNRIPINKAFYIVYLLYSSKGTISSHQLSEKLGIRQSTCWSYAIRIKKVMLERKKEVKKGGKQGWSRLVIAEQTS
ncbi:chromosome partitioning protein ParA [Mucilaginibacter sp. R11]|uniref:Chromosome partitioning protein ParA n=2 Tax=Mucilaginibacter agri TaxID=2695265 RepID=A0A965ZFR1_9SPHI|nr:chromosome partitioning protein ParA [Mucilaginibacter agri]